MLTSHELELLTAAADGELSPSRTPAFHRLLTAKPEAGELFRAMQSDATAVHSSARGPIPVSQVGPILGRIQPQARPFTRRSPASRRTLLLQYAIAASIFFTLCSASFWVFTARDRREQDKAQIRRLPVVDPSHLTPERDSFAIAPSAPHDSLPEPRERPGEHPMPPEAFVQSPRDSELAPAPRSAHGDVVGANIVENPKPLTEIRLRLPFLTEVADFALPDVQTRLKQELAQDSAFRLDLFSNNPAVALELLTAAAKASGMAVTVDARTQELHAKKVPIALAFYMEGLSAPEIAVLLGSLARPTPVALKSAPFGAAHLVPLGGADIRDIKETLGVDLAPARSNRTGEPKSIAADTLGKITGTVKKSEDKTGIVVAFLPQAQRPSPAQSKEVKAFLDKRGERKAGTTPLFIVLRPQG